MPVDYSLYPDDWSEIRARILERAGGRCECSGICGLDHSGRCMERNGEAARWSGAGQMELKLPGVGAPTPPPTVILTVAHLDHGLDNHAEDNLSALCQVCHLRYDRVQHAENAARTRRENESRPLPGQVSLIFSSKNAGIK